MRNRSIVLTSALSLLLSACGGGGGGSNDGSSGGAQPPPAAAPFKLTATTPADGAVTGIDAVPTATFDATPAGDTLTPTALWLSSPIGTVDTKWKLSGNTVTLTPAQPLVWGTRYQLNAATTLASTAGGKLAAAASSGFDTRLPTWGKVDVIDKRGPSIPANRDISQFTSSYAANGDITSIWLVGDDKDPTMTRLEARQYRAADDRWSPPMEIQGNNLRAKEPQVSVNAAGDAFAVWVEQQPNSKYVVRASRYEASNLSWSAPVTISKPSNTSSQNSGPNAAIGSNGNIIVVWTQYDDEGVSAGEGVSTSKSTVDAAYYDAASKRWSPARSLQDKSVMTNYPSADIDARGNAIVLWTQMRADGQNMVAHAARYDAAAKTWGNSVMVPENTTEESQAVAIGFDPAGEALALWRTRTTSPQGNQDRVVGARLGTATNTWGKSETIYEGEGSPNIAFDAAGNVMLAWGNFSDEVRTWAIQSRRYQKSTGSWIKLPLIVGRVYSAVSTAVDPAGNVVAAWLDYTPWVSEDMRIFKLKAMRFSAATGKWDEPVTLVETMNSMTGPVASIDSRGQATLQWMQRGDPLGVTPGQIQFIRFTGR